LFLRGAAGDQGADKTEYSEWANEPAFHAG
jgi:hypothetical protein